MYSYYYRDLQYVVVNTETGEIIDSFTDFDHMLEVYPDIVEM